jgi:hypothetical protein
MNASPKRKLFICTWFEYKYLYGGAAILREALPYLAEKFEIHWYYYDAYPADNEVDNVLQYAKVYPIHIPKGRKYLNTIVDYYLFYQYLPRQAKSIMKQVGPDDTVWLILEKTIIPLAYTFAKHKNFKLHISLHDCCRYFYDIYYWIGREKTESYLKEIYGKATSADFVGFKMLEDYHERFGATGGVFRRGMITDDVQVKVPKPKSSYQLLFLGTSHAQLSWVNLLKVLGSYPQRFTITVHSDRNPLEGLVFPTNVVVDYRGTKKEAEIMAERDRFDFGLFFWEHMRDDVARLSVSTKFTTYARMGLPMIGGIDPRCELYEIYEFGMSYNIADHGTQTLEEWILAFDPDRYKEYLRKRFDRDQLLQDFLRLESFAG